MVGARTIKKQVRAIEFVLGGVKKTLRLNPYF